jgi:hypothetical protein
MKAEENRMSLWKQYNARVDAALAKEGLPMKEGEKPSKVF